MTKETSTKDLTTKQAAQQLGLSKAADVRNLIKLNLLPGAYKDNGTWRIPQSAIDNYKQNPEITSVSAPKLWERFKSHPWVFWPTVFIGILSTIALFVFAAISFGADFRAAQEQLYNWGLIHRFPPRRDDEILIVIATFYTGPGEPDSDIQDTLYTGITEQINNLNLVNIHVQIDKAVIPAHDREQARLRAQYHNATMIIWGNDTDFQVQTNFLNLATPEYHLSDKSIEETERTSLAAPPEYVEFVNKELKSQISFLSFFAIADSLIGQKNESAKQIFIHMLDMYPTTLLSELQASQNDIWGRLGYVYALDSEYALSVNSFSEVLSRDPENAAAYNNRGISYYMQGDLEAAIADFNQALNIDSKDITAYSNRGLAYAKQGNFEAALTDYNQVLSIDPNYAYAYIQRGYIYDNQDNYEAALADFNQAVALEPKNPASYNSRAIHYNSQGNFKAALEDYAQALEFDPEYAATYNNRGNIYKNQGNFEAALADYTQALHLGLEYATVYTNRGETYIYLGNPEAALADFNKALTLDPEHANAYTHRGLFYVNKGDFDAALSDLNKALSIDPEDTNAYTNRGAIFAAQGDFETALSDLNRAIALDSENEHSYYNRGYAYYNLGDLESALIDLRHYIELAPEASDRNEVEKLIRELAN